MNTVTPMRWWHIEYLLELEQELFGPTAWSAAQFWGELARDNRRYHVLTDESERIIGYAGMVFVGAEADVQTIAVAPDAQGHGWGRVLLDVLIEDARSCGCAQLMLEVRADNEPAIALYAHAGFEVISTRRSYYGPGEDAVIMRLRPIPKMLVPAS